MDNTSSPKECRHKIPMLLPSGLSSLTLHTHLTPQTLSHFPSISACRTRQENSAYTAATLRFNKHRGKHPRDRSGVRSSELTRD